MQPYQFEYLAPQSLEEAIAMLARADGDAQVISGGQSLVAAMNLRLARPAALVDLRRIPGLDRLELQENSLSVGARVTHAQIIESDLARSSLPILCEAGRHIAHSTIRARGTMAGSLALADPAAEWPTVLVALSGSVVVQGPLGERRIPAMDFFVSLYTTALRRDEIISKILIPLPAAGERHGFSEFARQSGAFALAVAAAAVRLDSQGDLRSAVIALGGCGPKPLRFELASMVGRKPVAVDIDAAVASLALSPSSDIHATAESRSSIARAVMKRAVYSACGLSKKGN